MNSFEFVKHFANYSLVFNQLLSIPKIFLLYFYNGLQDKLTEVDVLGLTLFRKHKGRLSK